MYVFIILTQRVNKTNSTCFKNSISYKKKHVIYCYNIMIGNLVISNKIMLLLHQNGQLQNLE